MLRTNVAALSLPALLLPLRAQAGVPHRVARGEVSIRSTARTFAPPLRAAAISFSGSPAARLPLQTTPILTAADALKAPENAAAEAEAPGPAPVAGPAAQTDARSRGLRTLEQLGRSMGPGGKAGAGDSLALDRLFDQTRAKRGAGLVALAAPADDHVAAAQLPKRRPVSRAQVLARLPQAASLPGRGVEEMLSALNDRLDRSRTTARTAGDLARFSAGFMALGTAGAALFWGSPAAASVPAALAVAALGALLALGFSALRAGAESRFYALDRLRRSLSILPYLDLPRLDAPPAAAKTAARRSPGARQDGKAGVFLLSMLALFALGALLGPANSAGFLVSTLKLLGGVIAALLGFFGMVFVVDDYGVGHGLERWGRGLLFTALVIGGGWLAGPVIGALVP